jgi:hypothetical protein
LEYAEPRGDRVVCRNSERASVVVTVQHRRGRRWQTERSWRLDGTAHAEVGGRE